MSILDTAKARYSVRAIAYAVDDARVRHGVDGFIIPGVGGHVGEALAGGHVGRAGGEGQGGDEQGERHGDGHGQGQKFFH